ncbi:MAG: ThuA domain-containing protein [Bryobacter sp.]|nr:ThuA domain-containing protein [Bryobacter sp.]
MHCWIARLLLIVMAWAGSLSAESRVLILVGPSNHPPGTHEVEAGGMLLAWALEHMDNVPGMQAEVHTTWPGEKALERADGVVFIGDVFPLQRWPDKEANLAALGRLLARGKGIVCLHYATGLRKEDVGENGEHPLLGWLGGYFATGGATHHRGVARVMKNVTVQPATVQPATAHPVTRGWKAFTLDDEPYFKNYFGPNGNQPGPGVSILATAQLPPEAPQREAVAWSVERADGGRGVGIVMPHFFANWGLPYLRRFILNAVVWAVKREVPAGGVAGPAPDLGAFGAGELGKRY